MLERGVDGGAPGAERFVEDPGRRACAGEQDELVASAVRGAAVGAGRGGLTEAVGIVAGIGGSRRAGDRRLVGRPGRDVRRVGAGAHADEQGRGDE